MAKQPRVASSLFALGSQSIKIVWILNSKRQIILDFKRPDFRHSLYFTPPSCLKSIVLRLHTDNCCSLFFPTNSVAYTIQKEWSWNQQCGRYVLSKFSTDNEKYIAFLIETRIFLCFKTRQLFGTWFPWESPTRMSPASEMSIPFGYLLTESVRIFLKKWPLELMTTTLWPYWIREKRKRVILGLSGVQLMSEIQTFVTSDFRQLVSEEWTVW